MTRDLTRWNRAGLSRFRYVDANAITYLERLRADLARSFPDWDAVQTGAETSAERLQRIRHQYEGSARERPAAVGAGKDWAWEVARAFARSLHVLTEHLDAYANEGFIDTATQWENVRRLVGMLDYRPSPPSSASTLLVLTAKAPGRLRTGFAVQHVPTEQPPVVFETLEDLDVVPEADALLPAGAGRNPGAVPLRSLHLVTGSRGLLVGEPLVLQQGTALSAHLIEAVHPEAATGGGEVSRVDVRPAVPSGFRLGDTVVHVQPQDRLTLTGPQAPQPSPLATSVQLTAEPTGLATGDVVHLTDGAHSYLRRVAGVRGRRVVLTQPIGLLDTGTGALGPAVRLPVQHVGRRLEGAIRAVRLVGDWRHLLGRKVGKLHPDGSGVVEYTVMGADYHRPEDGGADAGMTVLRATSPDGDLDDRNPQYLILGPEGRGPWQADSVLATDGAALPLSLDTSTPRKAGPGDLLVLCRGHQLALGEVAAVTLAGDRARLTMTAGSWRTAGGGPWFLGDTTASTAFGSVVRLAGWDRNDTALTGTTVTLRTPLPEVIAKGRRVVLRTPSAAVATTVLAVRDRTVGTVELADAVPADATAGSLVVCGNVVVAGHGESRPDRVLGSGDATRGGQSFPLDVADVSFVGDPSQATGVRADLHVTVDGRAWHQVATLADSGPTEPHYTVRMTEDGTVQLTFGDGRHGRRLPTGQNNVRVHYRQGTGLRGLLAPGLLTRPVRPSPLVAAVTQPFATAGGNDMEDVSSLRQNAPAATLTLDRAVSLADLTHLANTNSKVWQAVALPEAAVTGTRGGSRRGDRVVLVVVTPGGRPLREEPDSAESIRRFLLARTVPGVHLGLADFGSVEVRLDVVVRVDTGMDDPVVVVDRVRLAVEAALGLRRRRLGQSLEHSDVVAVVEAVPGVVNSRLTLQEPAGQRPERLVRSGHTLRAVRPRPDQVVWLARSADLAISAQEATL